LTERRGGRRAPALTLAALLGLLAPVLPGWGPAGVRPAAAQTFQADSIQTSRLPNGLDLVVKQNPGASLVALSVWVKAGSANETYANSGVAHLLEHTLFEGDPNQKSDPVDRAIEAMGGALNAETTRDSTHFYLTVPRESFGPALQILAHMIRSPVFDQAHLDEERQRAGDELQQRLDDPSARLQQALFSMAYGAGSYALPVAGSPLTVARLTMEQLRSFYATCYRPDNAVLVIVGEVTLPDALAAARSDFGDWAAPAGPPPSAPAQHHAESGSPAALPLRSGAQTGSTMIGVALPAPSIEKPTDAAIMDLIYTLVTSGSHSLLSRRLGATGLITDYGSDFLTQRRAGLFLIWGTTRPTLLHRARQTLIDTVAAVATGDFTDDDLARARQILLGSYTLGNETVADQNTGLGFYEAIGSYTYAVDYDRLVQAATRNDVRRVAQEYFRATYVAALAPQGATL
jgi:zinc protease